MPYPRGRSESTPTSMPFGRHKGEKIRDLPDEYIGWMLNNAENLRPPLKGALEAEQQRRGTGEPAASAETWMGADAEHVATAREPVTGRPAIPTESPHPAASKSTTDDQLRRIVRHEIAVLFKRLAAALEREDKK
jgi:hypothetical protein